MPSVTLVVFVLVGIVGGATAQYGPVPLPADQGGYAPVQPGATYARATVDMPGNEDAETVSIAGASLQYPAELWGTEGTAPQLPNPPPGAPADFSDQSFVETGAEADTEWGYGHPAYAYRHPHASLYAFHPSPYYHPYRPPYHPYHPPYHPYHPYYPYHPVPYGGYW